jgi:hypothetical protein
MERGPHRDFLRIERTTAPAFRESRAANRRDVADEVTHDYRQYAERAAGSHVTGVRPSI